METNNRPRLTLTGTLLRFVGVLTTMSTLVEGTDGLLTKAEKLWRHLKEDGVIDALAFLWTKLLSIDTSYLVPAVVSFIVSTVGWWAIYVVPRRRDRERFEREKRSRLPKRTRANRSRKRKS